MRQSYRKIFIVLFLSFVLGLAGCQQKGPAEKAGEKIDQAGEAVAEKVKKAGD